MKISIIIPVYNAKDTIANCVKSILNSSDKEIQVILINDKSRDNSADVCRELQKTYKQIELYDSVGSGPSAARNTGLKHVNGDIIGFCDADDYYEPDAISIVKNEFSNDSKLDVLVTAINVVDKKNNYDYCKCKKKSGYYSSHKMLEMVLCDEIVMGSVWNKFYKADILEKIFFNESLTHCEDAHFNAKVFTSNRNARCKIINIPTYNYIIAGNSLTTSYDKLFNENGVLKYSESIHCIGQQCNLTKSEENYLRRSLYKLSICNISIESLDNIKRQNLYNDIKNNILIFLIFSYKFGFKSNINLFLRGAKKIILKK